MNDQSHVEASIGGWPGPAYSIRGTGTTLEYEHVARYGEDSQVETLEVSREEVAEFWSSVDAVGIWDWAADYSDDQVLDGTHWTITLEHGGRRVESQGSNAYPDGFEAVCAALSRLCGGRPFE